MDTSEPKLLLKYGIRPKKFLSQVFLINPVTIQRIVKVASLKPNDLVIEIGAGSGTLTNELLKTKAKVIAIEKDPQLCQILKQRFKEEKNLTIIHTDALKFDYKSQVKDPQRNCIIVGNIPYHITSLLIQVLFQQRELFSQLVLTLQKEFAERITASPGTKQYGALTIFSQLGWKIVPKFNIPSSDFSPRPKVCSTVLSFKPHQNLEPLTEIMVQKITKAVFKNRRKMILNGLKSICSQKIALKALSLAEIDPKRRPETLSLEEFIKLTNSILKVR
jgi:16S rRNA (adenine1518-N6/adenine1519-N6)-dimethyltransferase